MSTNAKGLFGYLVVFILLSTILGYAGIEHLRNAQYPPFADGMFTGMGWILHPPGNVILFLDSWTGRILVWAAVLVGPVVCGLLAFKFNRGFWGYTILFCAAGVFGAIGFSLFIHGLIDTI